MRSPAAFVRLLCSIVLAGLWLGPARAADAPAKPPVKPPTTQQLLTQADRLRDRKQFDTAIQTAQSVIAMPQATAEQKQTAFELLVDVHQKQMDMDKALAAAVRMGNELAASPAALARSSVLQANICLKLKRNAEALAHLTTAIERSDDPRVRQECIYRIANLHASDSRYEQALAAYERLFTDNPGASDYWHEAQRAIVDMLRKLNRSKEALSAARICLDAGDDAGAIASNVQLIAVIFKELDQNVTRANAFLAYQQYGPAGKDARTGTPDDLTDPLADVPYPRYPGRDAAFAKYRPVAGDTFAASRSRALALIYAGHPVDALPHFAESLRRRHGSPSDIMASANDLIAIGVRSLRGHAVDLPLFYAFLRWGPAGPDQQSGTADDLKDPFADLGLKNRAPADDGGLVPPPEADRKALIELRGVLEKLILAERDETSIRAEFLLALHRLHDALCDWGTQGQTEWYLGLMLDGSAATRGPQAQTALARGAEAAARGSDLHFGGQAAFWRDLDAAAASDEFQIGDPARQVRKQFDLLLKMLDKPPSLAPKLAPLK